MLGTLFLLSSSSNEKAMGAVFLAALIAFVLSLCFPKVRKDGTLPTAFAAICLSVLLLFVATQREQGKTERLAGQTVSICGELTDLPQQSNGRFYYVLRLRTVQGEESGEKLRLSSRAPLDLNARDRINCTVKIFMLGQNVSAEIENYYRAKDMTLGGYAIGEVQIEKDVRTDVAGYILSVRAALLDALMTVLPNDNGAVLAAMSFGSSAFLSAEASNGFRAAGISHLLVVSGLHLSTWSLLLWGVLQKLGVRRSWKALARIGFLCFFVCLTGASPSVTRAAIMLGTVCAADLFRREADALNSVGVAVAGMLVVNPYAARSLSLLLSVLATVGILLLAKPIERWLCRPIAHKRIRFGLRIYHFAASAIAVTTAATVCTLPVQIWAIGTMSLVALPANLLMLSAGSVAMVLGTIGATLAACGLSVGTGTLLLAGKLAQYLLTVTGRFADSDFALLPLHSNYAKLFLALALVAAAIFLLQRSPKKRAMQTTAALLVCLFLCSNLFVFARSQNALQMTAVSVGDGMSVVLRCRGETVVLGCGGDYFADSEICDILSAYGATHIDALILPGEEDPVFSAAVALGAELPVAQVHYAASIKPETLPFAAEKTKISKSVLYFADNRLMIAVHSSGSKQYAKIQFGAFSALLSFSEENDFKGDNASVLFCTKTPPKNIDSADFQLTVFSVADAAAADFMSIRSPQVCTTAENGSITLLVRENGIFQYRRT